MTSKAHSPNKQELVTIITRFHTADAEYATHQITCAVCRGWRQHGHLCTKGRAIQRVQSRWWSKLKEVAAQHPGEKQATMQEIACEIKLAN